MLFLRGVVWQLRTLAGHNSKGERPRSSSRQEYGCGDYGCLRKPSTRRLPTVVSPRGLHTASSSSSHACVIYDQDFINLGHNAVDFLVKLFFSLALLYDVYIEKLTTWPSKKCFSSRTKSNFGNNGFNIFDAKRNAEQSKAWLKKFYSYSDLSKQIVEKCLQPYKQRWSWTLWSPKRAADTGKLYSNVTDCRLIFLALYIDLQEHPLSW